MKHVKRTMSAITGRHDTLKGKITVRTSITVTLLVALILLAGFVLPACIVPKPLFKVTSLTISLDEVPPGQEVMVSAIVENRGQGAGTYAVKLTADGEIVDSKTVSLTPSSSQTVRFVVVKDKVGTYNIGIGELTRTLTVREGLLPLLTIGDFWKYKSIIDGIEYTVTYEVTGEDIVDGRGSYVVEGSIEPPYEGILSKISEKIDKATMLTLRGQASGEYEGDPFIVAVSYTYGFLGAFPYPLEVWKEFKVTEVETITTILAGEKDAETTTDTYTYKIEKIEDITVPAGTFRCFKVVKYDEDGTAVSTTWVSDKVKNEVKNIDHETGESNELMSYSVF